MNNYVCVFYVVHNGWNSHFTFCVCVIMVIVCWAQAPSSVTGTLVGIMIPVTFTLNRGAIQPYIHQPPLIAPSYLDQALFASSGTSLV